VFSSVDYDTTRSAVCPQKIKTFRRIFRHCHIKRMKAAPSPHSSDHPPF